MEEKKTFFFLEKSKLAIAPRAVLKNAAEVNKKITVYKYHLYLS